MQPISTSGSIGQDSIEHIVVLMLENRSFDQMLGAFQAIYPDLDGIDPAATPRTNVDDNQVAYAQSPTQATVVQPDPMHELVDVLRQIDAANGKFVLDYALQYPQTSNDQRQLIMSYFALDFLPGLHRLAREFTICERWFASVPGPTWVNRFFVHSGTGLGRVKMPDGVFNLNLHWYDQTTLYDRLNERGLAWRIYYHDWPQSLVLAHQLEPPNAARYHTIGRFYADAAGNAAAFPAYSFIEPKYFWPRQNDDHPPHDSMRAQELTASVYNALRANAALWNSTLLLVLYDEHGGFYDHISPPPAVPPDAHAEEYAFDRLGVRVPALLISPWVDRGVFHSQLDHTSLLKYLADKGNLGPLGARTAQANTFAAAIKSARPPRIDTPESITLPAGLQFVPDSEVVGETADSLNEQQKALISFSHVLESRIEDDAPAKVRRFTAMMEGTQAQFRVATERVDLFIQQQKRKMLTI